MPLLKPLRKDACLRKMENTKLYTAFWFFTDVE